jgi:dihydroneopterin aldolase
MTGRIALEGLEFHSFHGVYPHERESGNWFEVDIFVDTDITSAALQDDLSGTINYESLFKIVQDEMEKPSKLLETVAHNIIEDVMRELPASLQVELKISKINPPIGGKCKKASIHLVRKRM